MNILVYCDGSAKDIAVACSLILTETRFLKRIVKQYNVQTAPPAELYSILQALEYLYENKDSLDIDKVLVFTDAKYLVVPYKKMMACGYVLETTSYRNIWLKVLKICKQIDVSLIYMESHQMEHNPNKTCDITGRLYRKFGLETV